MRTGKRCSTCRAVKPFAAFRKRSALKDGRQSACRACSDEYAAKYTKANAAAITEAHRLRKYSLSKDAFSTLYATQNGRCAICPRLLIPRGAQARQPHVDHDHRTRKVRGLLCGTCNRGLGMFKDDPSLLRAAAYYLGRA